MIVLQGTQRLRLTSENDKFLSYFDPILRTNPFMEFKQRFLMTASLLRRRLENRGALKTVVNEISS